MRPPFHWTILLAVLVVRGARAQTPPLVVSLEVAESVGYPEPLVGAVIFRNRSGRKILLDHFLSVRDWNFSDREWVMGSHVEFRQEGDWHPCEPDVGPIQTPAPLPAERLPPGASLRREADARRGVCHADYRPGMLELRYVYQPLPRAQTPGMFTGPVVSAPVRVKVQPYTQADIAYLEDERDGPFAAAQRHPDSLFAGLAFDRWLADGWYATHRVYKEGLPERRTLLVALDAFLARFPRFSSRDKLLWNALIRMAGTGDLRGATRRLKELRGLTAEEAKARMAMLSDVASTDPPSAAPPSSPR